MKKVFKKKLWLAKERGHYAFFKTEPRMWLKSNHTYGTTGFLVTLCGPMFARLFGLTLKLKEKHRVEITIKILD